MRMKVFIVLCLLAIVNGQKDPNAAPGHSVIVHLFEWTFRDVAEECERFLGPKGYAGAQVSSCFFSFDFQINSAINNFVILLLKYVYKNNAKLLLQNCA